MQALTFRDTQFDITDRDGQPWLQAAQIAKALGYAREDSISRIYSRNAEEFTACMTQTVKLTVKGFGNGSSEKDVRIFSLRGAHLLAMFARTEVAKEFRRWVLDVLDGLTDASVASRGRTPKALPNGLNAEQQDTIKTLVKARVEALPKEKQARAAVTCWSALKSKFGCSYKKIESDQFAEAVGLVARIELEGEWLGKPTAVGSFGEIVGHSLTCRERWMVSLDLQGKERYQLIPYDACVMTQQELMQAMVTPGELAVSTEEMFEFAMAAMANLKARSDYQNMRVKQLAESQRRA